MAPQLVPGLPIGLGIAFSPVLLYLLFLALSTNTFFQRHFLYAHKVHNLWWHDTDDPVYWGFSKNQVTPFSIETPDGISVYAWHILPLSVYMKNEDALSKLEPGFCKSFKSSDAFKLLADDPDAKLILSFHGNAGHIAQGWRPPSYHLMAQNYHVIAIDYRGFGHSNGSPTEEGLIQDGVSLVEFAMHKANVSPDRIVIYGQSLGTAVASGVADHFISQGIEFSGIVLVAPFSSLAEMLADYRISGYVPVLTPLKVHSGLLRWMQSFLVDKWRSGDRLANVVRLTKHRLRLTFVHAKNDKDIPCDESNKLFKATVNATFPGGLDDGLFQSYKEDRTIQKGKDAFVSTWTAEPNIIIRHEQFKYGGHNDVQGYSPVLLAIMRSFERGGAEELTSSTERQS